MRSIGHWRSFFIYEWGPWRNMRLMEKFIQLLIFQSERWIRWARIENGCEEKRVTEWISGVRMLLFCVSSSDVAGTWLYIFASYSQYRFHCSFHRNFFESNWTSSQLVICLESENGANCELFVSEILIFSLRKKNIVVE